MQRDTKEYRKTERPLLRQLEAMGWETLEGDVHVPGFTERDTFRQVLLEGRLRAAIERVNTGPDGTSWMDAHRVGQAVQALIRAGGADLLSANRAVTRLLLEGADVDGHPTIHGSRQATARFVDFERPSRNDFFAISQFRVDVPGRADSYIVPDVVLFVNGLPLVVVECKSPYATHPISAAVKDLLAYSNQRAGIGREEGNERLFHYNLAMVATSFDKAAAGALCAPPTQYVPWRDTSPVPTTDVAAELGKKGRALSDQELLVAGMLRPAHVLDLLENFTVYEEGAGGTQKIVARYQQFRAVHRALRRLRSGQTRHEHGLTDQRGGVVWHTQGAGKSLTMVFLIRKLRTLPALQGFKVVAITDRTDLEEQLSSTARLSGEPVRVAHSTSQLKSYLSRAGADLVFGMIQKYQDPEAAEESAEPFTQLNDSEDIVLLIDEAHRSHASTLHQNLNFALPNAAKIGFTGTPIIAEGRKKTRQIFGPFIDTYKLDESEGDEVTLPIRYEGRTTEGNVDEPGFLDDLFEDLFKERTGEELQRIKNKYATKGNVLEAPKMIGAKARSMLRHYVETVLPGGCKAMIAAVTRLAVVRYQEALEEARRELLQELEELPPELCDLTEAQIEALGEREQFLARAYPHRETIGRLEFAAVISEGENDDPAWRRWTNKTAQEARIERFKKPLRHEDTQKADGLSVLIVNSMLLTGFNAPVLQALYLDRSLRGHTLLQAIARVNRRYPGKTHGLLVDYYGVARHLSEALHEYRREDVEGALLDLKEELPRLEAKHRHVLALFEEQGIGSIEEEEPCVELLRDEEIRADFSMRLKSFLRALDVIMPRREAYPYRRDAEQLGLINRHAANRYYDEDLYTLDAGPKVRRLIDRHVDAYGVEEKIAPVTISEPQFDYVAGREPSGRAKAARMEHAVRHHISEHLPEDPVYYRGLSERLERILEKHREDWDEQARLFRELIEEIRARYPDDNLDEEQRLQAPFLRLVREAAERQDGALSDEKAQQLAAATVDLTEHIRQEIGAVDFWRNLHAQGELRSWIVRRLDQEGVMSFKKVKQVADQIMETARAQHARIVR